MDKQEFTRRVTAMQDRLYRLACGQLRSPHDRSDAVQEAILKAWCALSRLRDPALFDTWLTRILINECHNLQRSAARRASMDSIPEPTAPGAETDSPVRDAILELPEKYRLPVILHYMNGYTTEEIARILRVPTGTVRSRLKRARERLKETLASYDKGDAHER